MEYTIRVANDEDGLELARLRWEFRAEDGQERPAVPWDEFAHAYVEFFRTGRREASRRHWVTVCDGRLAGHVVVQKVDMVPRPCKVDDHWGYITDMYVRPASRNQGIGRALLEQAIGWSRDEDMELLLVWPSEEGVRHYCRAGFTRETDVLELRLRDYYDPAWALASR